MPQVPAVISLKDIEAEAGKEIPGSSPDKYSSLEGQLTTLWGIHKDAKRETGIESSMIESVRAFMSTYPEDKFAKLRAEGMSSVYFGLTGEKCRAALAWLVDAFVGEGTRPWKLQSTPLPAIPMDILPDIQAAGTRKLQEHMAQTQADGQAEEMTEADTSKLTAIAETAIKNASKIEVSKRVQAMEDLIDDQLIEGGWSDSFRDFLFDMVVLKAGILKGPVLREVKRKKWTQASGKIKMGFKWEPTLTISRVSPFDMYPSPSTVGFEGDVIERARFNLSDLFWMKKQPHFFADQVQYVIDNFSLFAGQNVEVADQDWAAALKNSTGEQSVKDTVESLDFWLAVTGSWLKAAGWDSLPDGKKVEDAELYNIEAMTVAGRVVFLGVLDDPLDRKPYYKNGWFPVPGSFWYQGLPEILKDLQDISSAASRSLVNNMGLASGFQVIIPDTRRVPPGEITNIFPHKVWQFTNKFNSTAPPIDFKQPESNAAALIGIVDQCKKWADDISGVPAYMLGGEQPPGVGRTAAGMSMLLNSAAKGIRRVVLDIDRNIIKPTIQRFYDWNLQNSKDPSVKGDAEVVASGAVETMIKSELAERQLKMLEAMNNPADLQLVGLRGRAAIWRSVLGSMDLNGQKLIKDDNEVEQLEVEANRAATGLKAAEQQQVELENQVSQTDLQLKQAQLALEQQRLQTEAQLAGMKMSSTTTENEQRAAITRRMAANADASTLKLLEKEREQENVPGGPGPG